MSLTYVIIFSSTCCISSCSRASVWEWAPLWRFSSPCSSWCASSPWPMRGETDAWDLLPYPSASPSPLDIWWGWDAWKHKYLITMTYFKTQMQQQVSCVVDVLHRCWDEPCQVLRPCCALQELCQPLGKTCRHYESENVIYLVNKW